MRRRRSIRGHGLLVTVALLGLLGLGCRSVRVDIDYDPDENFGTYKVYAWMPEGPIPTGDVRVDNDLIAKRVVAAVDNTLRGLGYMKGDDPDFYVNYALSVASRLDAYTMNRAYVDYYGWTVSVPDTRVRTYDEGTLIIDIADAREKALVWRGVGSTRISQGIDNQKVTETISKTVDEILKRFPPDVG